MTERYLIVFGEQAEQQMKKHQSRFKIYKEAQWLYEGILYQDGDLDEDIVNILFKDTKLAPAAMIDNGKWLAPALFASNQKIWRQVVSQCFSMARRDQIHCFAYVESEQDR